MTTYVVRTCAADGRQAPPYTHHTTVRRCADVALLPHASRTASSLGDPLVAPSAGFTLSRLAEFGNPHEIVGGVPSRPRPKWGIELGTVGVRGESSAEVHPGVLIASDLPAVEVVEQVGGGCAHAVIQPQTTEGVNHKLGGWS